MPCVSVIIPAFRARDSLPAALASVAASGLPPAGIEVVLAPDDGDSYDGLPEHGLRLVRCAPDHVASGAGAARNRALARARAPIVAFLDADDSWEPGYLAALLPLAGRHGVAFGRTRVLCDGRPLIVLPGTERAHLVLDDRLPSVDVQVAPREHCLDLLAIWYANTLKRQSERARPQAWLQSNVKACTAEDASVPSSHPSTSDS